MSDRPPDVGTYVKIERHLEKCDLCGKSYSKGASHQARCELDQFLNKWDNPELGTQAVLLSGVDIAPVLLDLDLLNEPYGFYRYTLGSRVDQSCIGASNFVIESIMAYAQLPPELQSQISLKSFIEDMRL